MALSETDYYDDFLTSLHQALGDGRFEQTTLHVLSFERRRELLARNLACWCVLNVGGFKIDTSWE